MGRKASSRNKVRSVSEFYDRYLPKLKAKSGQCTSGSYPEDIGTGLAPLLIKSAREEVASASRKPKA